MGELIDLDYERQRRRPLVSAQLPTTERSVLQDDLTALFRAMNTTAGASIGATDEDRHPEPLDGSQ